MNVQKLFFLGAIAASLFFTSCSNDLEINSPNPESSLPVTKSVTADSDFEIINGYINFKDSESFNKVYSSLTGKSDAELESWSRGYGYISLNEVYKGEESSFRAPERDIELDEIVVKIPNKVMSRHLATIINQRGIFAIQDSIYKVKDQYIYVINDGDFDKVKAIEEGADYTALGSVTRDEHSKQLMMNSNLRGPEYERSPVYKVSSKRREYVKFDCWVDNIPNQASFLMMKMEGRAQKKKLWWGIAFSDELVWGKIFLNGGTFNGINGLTNIIPVVSRKVTGECICEGNVNLGPSRYVNNIKCSVTFNYVKHATQGEQSYTNQYDL